jgi:hypothetical protein
MLRLEHIRVVPEHHARMRRYWPELCNEFLDNSVRNNFTKFVDQEEFIGIIGRACPGMSNVHIQAAWRASAPDQEAQVR